MLAVVRNRRALITAVEPHDAGPEGRFHLVSLEYTDADGPLEDRLLWEREPGASLIEPTALPSAEVERARELWDEVSGDVPQWVKEEPGRLTARLEDVLKRELDDALKAEKERYQARQHEISEREAQRNMQNLEKELAKFRRVRQQLHLDLGAQEQLFARLEQDQKAREEELDRMRRHSAELCEQLERDRIIKFLIPKRYALHGAAQVFPVTVEARV